MKKIIFLLGLITSSLYAQKTMENSIHQFTVEALEGEHFNFSDLKGKNTRNSDTDFERIDKDTGEVKKFKKHTWHESEIQSKTAMLVERFVGKHMPLQRCFFSFGYLARLGLVLVSERARDFPELGVSARFPRCRGVCISSFFGDIDWHWVFTA